MKKIPFSIILIPIILLGGCFVNTQDYDDETKEKAKNNVEKFIRNNYENIETIEFEEVKESPMGSVRVTGKVNGEVEFDAGLHSDTLEIGSLGTNEGFPEVKEECKEQTCE